jgi:hypothetical protein
VPASPPASGTPVPAPGPLHPDLGGRPYLAKPLPRASPSPPPPQYYRKRHFNVLGPAVGPTTANGAVTAFLLSQ